MPLSFLSTWIIGATRSGKTTRLLDYLSHWAESFPSTPNQPGSLLVFAATGDDRLELADRIATKTHGRFAIRTTNPLGFFQDEILLFWPLILEKHNLKPHFPLRLRPETEQELAIGLWQNNLDQNLQLLDGQSASQITRKILDFGMLAGAAGLPLSDVPSILQRGITGGFSLPEVADQVGVMLQQWRNWCLERGLLTYGLVMDLYGHGLLNDKRYLESLLRRYPALLADDVDNYPAITRQLFTHYLHHNQPVAFTYNPEGKVRLGLGADPDYLAELSGFCHIEQLPLVSQSSLSEWVDPLLLWISDTFNPWEEPVFSHGITIKGGSDGTSCVDPPLRAIQTESRAQLLRKVAEVISESIQSGYVQAQDIAIIGPGLDPIAHYTLTTILRQRQIPVQSLHDQRPLNSSPIIRALLTLLGLVYPGLGRLIDQDAIGEMLIILSLSIPTITSTTLPIPIIDPVRAGLIADHCFQPHPENPDLLPVTHFPRWDRLGYGVCRCYEEILLWLRDQRQQHRQRVLSNPIVLLDRAIQRFLWNGGNLPYDQLAALRELLETAQHYWEVANRLHKTASPPLSNDLPVLLPPTNLGSSGETATLYRFIQLLRDGTVTANPYPTRSWVTPRGASVTIATVFQYRAHRSWHRWQFWLDAGSSLWLTGVDSLLGAPIFLQGWNGRRMTESDQFLMGEERLVRTLKDLLGRTGERIYLCHSELGISGQEQVGPLLALINTLTPLE